MWHVILVHHFELQGRRFTNVHHYYYWTNHGWQTSPSQLTKSSSLASQRERRQASLWRTVLSLARFIMAEMHMDTTPLLLPESFCTAVEKDTLSQVTHTVIKSPQLLLWSRGLHWLWWASTPMGVQGVVLTVIGQQPYGCSEGCTDTTSQHLCGCPGGCSDCQRPGPLWVSKGLHWLWWASISVGVHRAALTVMDQYLCGCPWQLHRLSKASTPVGAQAVAVTVIGQYLCGCPRSCTVMGQYLCGCTRGCIVMGQYLCGCPWQLHKLSEASTSVGVQGAALIVKGQHLCGSPRDCTDCQRPVPQRVSGGLHCQAPGALWMFKVWF